MKTNTSEYIPHDCISANILIPDGEHPIAFMNGTGFFCQFPPFDYVFYVTAKHCLLKENEKDFTKEIKIPYQVKVGKEIDKDEKAIVFSEVLTCAYVDDETSELEDIIVLVVDDSKNKDELETLKKRSIKLEHQDDVDTISKYIIDNKENIRTIGFPKAFSEIDYEINEENYSTYAKGVELQPRGFYGKMVDTSSFRSRYSFENVNWKDEYNGFSGAPIFALIPDVYKGTRAMVIGVILTATKTKGDFLSINIATDLISEYIKKKNR